MTHYDCNYIIIRDGITDHIIIDIIDIIDMVDDYIIIQSFKNGASEPPAVIRAPPSAASSGA